ncbi:fimbrial assembly protein [Acidobacteria bacterium AB60]|nr:fimbrial assembly protein [Acidobacteria bacterium AB60]
MRITANLASRPFTDVGPILRRLRIAMGIMILVSIALGAGLYALHARAVAVRAREHSLDTSINTVRGEEQGYESLVRQPVNATTLEHAATLNKLFDAKAFSWTMAMEDLETVLPGGVQVSTLEPIRDSKDGHITLHLRVVGPRDKAVELVQNLERSRHFLAPRMTGEASENADRNANQIQEPVGLANRVTFDLMADYNPAAPNDRHAVKREASLENVSAPAPARHRAQRVPGPTGQQVPAMPVRKTPAPQGGPQ